LSYSGQYRISTVALAKSAKGQRHVSQNRPAIVVGIVAEVWAVSAYDWRGHGRSNLMMIVDCGVADFWKERWEPMRRARLVPIKTRHARTTLPPALGSSHERLICTMHRAVSPAAMCIQDPPAMRIVYRSLCRGSTLLITSHGNLTHVLLHLHHLAYRQAASYRGTSIWRPRPYCEG
jgi:hypothetical protein